MSGYNLLSQILVSTVVVFFFITSLLGLVLGLGLMVRASAVLPFILLMNQWVSTRQALRPLESPLEVPHGTTTTGRWFGAVLVLVGAYAALILIGSFDVHRVAALFRVDARYSLAGLMLDALKWFLVLGSLSAIPTPGTAWRRAPTAGIPPAAWSSRATPSTCRWTASSRPFRAPRGD